ncbi:M16 family metallopeptidase [Comamonas nitrativorans]|uniref:M16 family metallopeptidase n=1 Tax=Comamonas nitrativorans TaxID=108437 RepID=A0ABV9GZV0_9BURK
MVSAIATFYLNSAWAILPIEHWQQPSGAQVWLVTSPGIPMVDVQLQFDGGSRRDPAGQEGLANAVALMAGKGVQAGPGEKALDENALGQAWADLGAGLSAGAGNDGFSYSLRSLTQPDLLAQAATLASRQIAQPLWNAKVWQRERQRWSAALAESDTRPGTVTGKAFAQAVYGGHPYGRFTTAQTLAKVDIPAMQDFHRQTVLPCRAKVSVVGALDKTQADALVTQLLQRLPQPDTCPALPAVGEVPELAQAQDIRIPFAAAQAQIILGQPGIRRSDPDFFALMLGDHILGGGGFTSRLMEEVREKRGLTYGISSSMAPGLHAGAFTIGLKTRPDQAEQALAITRQVLADFVANGPTEAELQAAKDNLIGGFALRLDSNRKLLGNVANIAWNGLPLDYLEHWTDRLQAVTVADVRAALQRHWQPDRLVTVVLGAQTAEKQP